MAEFGNILKLKPAQFADGLDTQCERRDESRIISKFLEGGSENRR